jgi:hypothetical protein
MADGKKIFSAREAAEAVLAKAREILTESSLMKAEKLKKDGATLGSMIGYPGSPPPPPVRKAEDPSKMSGKTGTVRGTTEANLNQKGVNQLGNNGSSGGMSEAGNAVRNSKHMMPKQAATAIVGAKESHKKTLGDLKSMSKPNLGKSEPARGSHEAIMAQLAKYETENDPKPGVKYGKLETDQKPIERDYNEYEVKKPSFKDSDGKRQEKQVSPSGNPKEEAEGNNKPGGMEPRYEFKNKVKKELDKEDKAHKGEPKDQTGNTGINKSEKNPDTKEDADLGEKVEKDVEEHMSANKAAEKAEGHKIMKKSDQNMPAAQPKAETPTEQASIPRLILSAKLAKFMEHKHSKRKNAEAQGQQAVGQNGPAAPQQGSTQAGQPDPTRPATQPKTGDEDHMGKSYEGFKAVEASAAKSGASNPAAVAAAAGMKKYGKKKFEESAHEGKKMGHKK